MLSFLAISVNVCFSKLGLNNKINEPVPHAVWGNYDPTGAVWGLFCPIHSSTSQTGLFKHLM